MPPTEPADQNTSRRLSIVRLTCGGRALDKNGWRSPPPVLIARLLRSGFHWHLLRIFRRPLRKALQRRIQLACGRDRTHGSKLALEVLIVLEHVAEIFRARKAEAAEY